MEDSMDTINTEHLPRLLRDDSLNVMSGTSRPLLKPFRYVGIAGARIPTFFAYVNIGYYVVGTMFQTSHRRR